MVKLESSYRPEPREIRTPAALLGYQQRWCADTSPVKITEKSRRIGLSWGEAADSALLSSEQKGMDCWYSGYNKDMAQEFIRDCADFARFYDLACEDIEEGEEVFGDGKDDKAIKTFVIRFASGYRITSLSSRPSNLRGKQGRIIIDEAAFHENLGELLKAAMALLMWGGQVHIISTHNGVDNPFNNLVTDTRAGNSGYSLHRVTFDDAIADGLYQRICLRLGKPWTQEGETEWIESTRKFYGDDADEELDCIPKHSGGAYLSRALIESRMSPHTRIVRWSQKDEFTFLSDHIREAEALEFCDREIKPLIDALPKKARSFLGEDFGRSGDLTVLSPIYQIAALKRQVAFLVELRNIPFDQQRQILFYLLDRLPRFTGAALDARGNGQYLAEVAAQKYGQQRIHAIMFTEQWYLSHMPPFKAALEDGTLTDIPDDSEVLNDLRAFQVIRGVAKLPDTRTKDKDGKKRHGDAGISLVLGHYASRELDKGPVSVKSRGRRKSYGMTKGYR
uniref:Mu-like prophage FluMu protein gp28 n=1 Tax=Candidatus Kentrum sp. LFY TaxID=2126342 RepID=A0A450WXJ1_9GAMM|nr:MAG: Mu-like prophage FluMu protein gp28 [Candidatus Kentron sp. LFY]